MIEIKNLSKTYTSSGIKSLDDITMNIKKGTILGLIGTNGAGKSTLLRILAGIYKQDSGSLLIDGQNVFENNITKQKIAYISDEQYYIQNYTLEQMSKIYSSFRTFSQKRFNGLIDKFKLAGDRKISTFSKGMRRQGEVILSLSLEPSYMFCDETFDGLDPLTRQIAKHEIIDRVAESNTTVILSSHNLRELEDICDQIALIHDGRLVLNKNIDDIKDNVYKFQFIFNDPIEKFELDGVLQSKISSRGKVISFIAKGKDEIESAIGKYAEENNNPLIYFEALPLTLDEIFSYELDVRGLNKLINGGGENE